MLLIKFVLQIKTETIMQYYTDLLQTTGLSTFRLFSKTKRLQQKPKKNILDNLPAMEKHTLRRKIFDKQQVFSFH